MRATWKRLDNGYSKAGAAVGWPQKILKLSSGHLCVQQNHLAEILLVTKCFVLTCFQVCLFVCKVIYSSLFCFSLTSSRAGGKDFYEQCKREGISIIIPSFIYAVLSMH